MTGMNQDSLSVFQIDSAAPAAQADTLAANRSDSLFEAEVPALKTFLSADSALIIVPSQQETGSAGKVPAASGGWVFWVLLGSLAIISMVRFSFPRRFGQILAALASERSLVNMLREGDPFTERIMPGLILIFSGSVALLLLMLSLGVEGLQDALPLTALTWALASAAVLLWWTLRSLLIWAAGYLFHTFEATGMYLSRVLTMNMGLGMALSVLVPLAWYAGSHAGIMVILWLYLLANLYRIFRSISDGLRLTSYGLVYLILFAFTVEGLPLMLAVGFLRHNVL